MLISQPDIHCKINIFRALEQQNTPQTQHCACAPGACAPNLSDILLTNSYYASAQHRRFHESASTRARLRHRICMSIMQCCGSENPEETKCAGARVHLAPASEARANLYSLQSKRNLQLIPRSKNGTRHDRIAACNKQSIAGVWWRRAACTQICVYFLSNAALSMPTKKN